MVNPFPLVWKNTPPRDLDQIVSDHLALMMDPEDPEDLEDLENPADLLFATVLLDPKDRNGPSVHVTGKGDHYLCEYHEKTEWVGL